MAMSASWPSVSVVICAYNYERFVAESIDSALAQEYPADRLEIIVVDDGSTDGTPDILARYADRVRVVRQPNAGLIAATTRGIEESTGDLIAILDADDAWRPDKLRRQVELLQARPEVGLVFSDKEMVDEHGRRIAPSFLAQGGDVPKANQLTHLLAYNFVPAPSLVFRREHVERILPFSPAATAQDWWIAIRVAQVALLDYVPLPLVRYRVHGSNMGIGSRGEKLRKLLAGFLGFQRWNLIHLDGLEQIPASGLHAVWQRYLLNANQLGLAGDESVEAVLEPHRDAAAAAASVGRAVEAFGAGDARAAFRHLLAARVADPFDGDVRTAYEDVLAELQDAEEADLRAARASVLRAHDHPVRGRLAWARDRLAAGEPAAAAHVLQELEKQAVGTPDAAEVSTALALAALEADSHVLALRAGRDALRAGATDVDALHALARAAAAGGDHRAAVHWAERAVREAPADAAAWRDLGLARLARAQWRPAIQALDRAAELSPLPVDVAARADDARRAAAAEAAASVAAVAPAPADGRGAVLICVDRFRADRDGRLAEAIAVELKALGRHVEIATRAVPDGVRGARKRMTQHVIRQQPREELERLLARRRFDALLVLGGPSSWPVRHALAVEGRPRTVVLPTITERNEHVVRDSPLGLRSFRELMDAADVVARSTRTGRDALLLGELAVPAVDVPLVAPIAGASGSLRRRLRLADAPLLLAPSLPDGDRDFAMLRALSDAPGDWNLVVATSASAVAPEWEERLSALAAHDRRVTVATGVAPATLTAGLREAAIVLAPAPHGGVAPAVLAAMAAGAPWITAHGSASAECCGGIVTPPPGVVDAIDFLLEDAETRAALGAAGRADAARRSVRHAAARLDALLRGADVLPPAAAPDEAVGATDAAQAAFLERSVARPGVALTSSAAAALR
jgi:glycosyltransferase involved in cell wall biosynthesis